MASKTTVVKRKQPEQSASSGGSQLSSKRMKYVSEYLPRVAELVRSSASSQSQTSSTSDEDYIPALPSNTLSRYYHSEEPVVGSEESSDSGSVADETDSPEEILQTARASAVFLSQISDDIVAASSLARNRCVKGHRTLEPTASSSSKDPAPAQVDIVEEDEEDEDLDIATETLTQELFEHVIIQSPRTKPRSNIKTTIEEKIREWPDQRLLIAKDGIKVWCDPCHSTFSGAQLDTIEVIARDESIGSRASRTTLKDILDNNEKILELECELTLISDCFTAMVSYCYYLEGDGFLAPFVYEVWCSIMRRANVVINDDEYPSYDNRDRATKLWKKCQELEKTAKAQIKLFEYHIAKVFPVFEKVRRDSINDKRLRPQLLLYQFCQLFNVYYVASKTVQVLHQQYEQYADIVLSISTATKDTMKRQLPKYYQMAQNFVASKPLGNRESYYKSAHINAWQFFNLPQYQENISSWCTGAKNIALLMPSSACVERLFSQYSAQFSDRKESTLEDRRSYTIMLHYNTQQRELDSTSSEATISSTSKIE